jgi:hypothetical protein
MSLVLLILEVELLVESMILVLELSLTTVLSEEVSTIVVEEVGSTELLTGF